MSKATARHKAIKDFKANTALDFSGDGMYIFATAFNMGWDAHRKAMNLKHKSIECGVLDGRDK